MLLEVFIIKMKKKKTELIEIQRLEGITIKKVNCSVRLSCSL